MMSTHVSGNTTPYPLDQLVFRQRGFQKVDLVTLGGEIVSACLIDVFQQQDFDIFGGERF